eukprot:22585-Chlamydomonas_euryale.AAC.1
MVAAGVEGLVARLSRKGRGGACALTCAAKERGPCLSQSGLCFRGQGLKVALNKHSNSTAKPYSKA